MAFLKRLVRALPLLVLSPVLMALSFLALVLTDLVGRVRRRGPGEASDSRPALASASVVIPNWNGKDLLEKYLPSIVEALAGNSGNEIVVVDNGSTDGSADFVRSHFPQVNLLALPANLGFGGGSNAGFRAAKNDIVVLLNSDMRVAPDFLAPLLEGFHDPEVFAVACQIFFSDPDKLREETGLTQGWWQDGGLRVRHRIDPAGGRPVPLLLWRWRLLRVRPPQVPGTGRLRSAAGALLPGRHRSRIPGVETRLESASISRAAWSTMSTAAPSGRRFSEDYIQAVLKKNFVLFCWKNIHEWPRLSLALFLCLGGRRSERDFRRCPRPPQSGGVVARISATAAGGPFAGARPGTGSDQRYRSIPAAAGRLLSRSLRHRRSAP